jgi:hypothetical protein
MAGSMDSMSRSKDSDYTIMVNADKILQLLIQVVVTRITYVEERFFTLTSNYHCTSKIKF